MKKLNAIFYFLVFLILYNLLVYYVGFNLSIFIDSLFNIESKKSLLILVFIFAYLYIFGSLINVSILKIIGSYWMVVLQYSILLLPVVNLIYFILLKYSSVSQSILVNYLGGILSLIFLFIFIIGTYNAYSPIVKTYDVYIDKEASGIKDLKVVMASDMHFGAASGKKHLQRLVKETNQLNPDIVLFPGDIIDDDPKEFIKKNMDEDMSQIKSTYGVFVTLGNHEYYGGKIPQFIELMNSINVNVLTDEIKKIDNSFYIIGRNDETDKNRKTLEDILVDVDKSFPLILLEHQPKNFDNSSSNGIDLMLSGHTHLGQMFPNQFITNAMFENDYGYMKKDNLHSIVSSGFGFWGPPIRIGSRSELLLINVEFKK